MDDSNNDETYLNDLPLWADDQTRSMLERVCEQYKVPMDVIAELVMVQRERQHQERAHGINLRFEEILGRLE